MAVVGEKEQEAGTVSVRQHGKGDLGSKSIPEFLDQLTAENNPGSQSQIK